MSSLAMSLIAFSVIFGAGVIGALLPGHVLPEGTKDVVRQGSGLIATMSGLVLGLLVASAHGSFEAQGGQVRQISTDVTLLDALLRQYGPEGQKARSLLRESIPPFVEQIWKKGGEASDHFKPTPASVALYLELDNLNTQSDAQRSIKPRMTAVYTEIVQIRLQLLERAHGGIPNLFVGVLVVWLALIFLSIGLFSNYHYSVLVALFIAAASVSGALYLILELNHPFDGFLRIPSDPLLNALAPLGN